LLRADTQVALPDRNIAVPHHALDLPMNGRDDPQSLEAAARQLARLGGWPARRRGYALSGEPKSGEQSGAYTITSLAHDAESPIRAD
jgi:hypothetical protein